MILTSIQRHICDLQGRLFVFAGRENISCDVFINFFMQSDVARHMDLQFDRTQWASELWLLEEIREEAGGFFPHGKGWNEEVMFWTGYTYRNWHFATGSSSAQINRIADAQTMRIAYPGYHTLGFETTVERLIEDYEERQAVTARSFPEK